MRSSDIKVEEPEVLNWEIFLLPYGGPLPLFSFSIEDGVTLGRDDGATLEREERLLCVGVEGKGLLLCCKALLLIRRSLEGWCFSTREDGGTLGRDEGLVCIGVEGRGIHVYSEGSLLLLYWNRGWRLLKTEEGVTLQNEGGLLCPSVKRWWDEICRSRRNLDLGESCSLLLRLSN